MHPQALVSGGGRTNVELPDGNSGHALAELHSLDIEHGESQDFMSDSDARDTRFECNEV
jgi:hypothetical protein